MNAYWFLAVFFVLSLAGVFVFDTYVHEQVHVQVQEYFGCQDSRMVFRVFGSSYTECMNYSERPADVVRQEYQLHALNEIVNYNLYTLILSMVVCTLFLGGVMLWKR